MSTTRQRSWYVPSLQWCIVPAVFAVLALMVHTLANTVMRIAGAPLQGSLEYGSYWYLPLLAFAGMVLAQRDKEQIEATLVFDRLSPASKREFLIVGYVLMIVVALLYAWFGWGEAVHSMEVSRTAGASGVSIWPMMFAVPVASVLLVIQLVLDIRSALRAPLAEPEQEAGDEVHHNGERAEL